MTSKSNESLFDLIQSLTKSEKRYFKLHASRHTIGETNNYVLLFDYIDKLEAYDEQALREHFKKESFLNKFSITKKRLYDQILHALTQFHLSQDVEARLYGMLHSAEILFQKSLYNQSKKVLVSAEKLAQKHELTNIQLEIRKKMKKLFEKNNYLDLDLPFIQSLALEDKEFHARSEYEDALWIQKSKVFRQLMQSGPARTQDDRSVYDQILLETEALAAPKHPTFGAHYMKNHIMSAYYFGLTDLEKSFNYLEKNWHLFAQNPIQTQSHPDRYLSVLTNMIYTSDKLGYQDKANTYLDELRKWETEIQQKGETDLQSKYFSTLSSIELSLLTKQGAYQELAVKLPEIESGIQNFELQLTEIRKAYFYFKMAEVNLALGHPNFALKYIRMVIDNNDLDKKEDILGFAHLLEVLIHIELGNFDMMPYLVRNTRRYLKTRNRLYPMEKELLSAALKFQENQSKFEKEDIWNALVSKFNDPNIVGNSDRALEYFDFYSWAIAKTSSRTFIELIRDKCNQIQGERA